MLLLFQQHMQHVLVIIKQVNLSLTCFTDEIYINMEIEHGIIY